MKRGKRTLRRVFAVTVLCSLFVLHGKLIATSGQSNWYNNSNPVFAVQDTDATNSLPSTFISHGNIDCTNLTFTKRDGLIIPPLFYKESQLSDCFFDTTAGEVQDNGYINVPGTPYVAEAVHPDHTPYPLMAFPYSDVYVSTQSGSPAIGNYVWLSNLRGSVNLTKSLTGKLWAEVTPITQTPIADRAGNLLPVLLDNFGSSSDGKWAVVDSPGRGIIRINLETMEILPFTESLENGNGTGSAIRIAISSDGRFVAVASKAYNYLRVFDLNTCGTVPNVITQPVSCQWRDFNTFTRSQIADFGGVLQMRFVTNDQLKVYASYDISTDSKIGQFAIAAPGTILTGIEYLGMGDSFSSGEGSQNYEVGTDDVNNKCHLSRLSYPYLIAKQLNINSFHSVACSGAVTYNIIGGSGIDKNLLNTTRDNQFNPDNKPLQNSLGAWLPGYTKQLKFVTENQPQLITLSIIGNDLGFGDIAKACAMPGTCYPTYEDRMEVFSNVDSKLDTLTNLFKKLKAGAPKNARIYAVGYPQIALSTGVCGLNVHMGESELTFAGMLIDRIDLLVKTAASQAGIYYADIEDAFTGHRLCEANNSEIAMNGLTAGNDIKGVVGNESFHPNAYGQFLMAQKILSITNNLGIPAPEPLPTIVPIRDDNLALANLPKTNRTLNKLRSFTPVNSVIKKGQSIAANLDGFNYALQPNTTYTILSNSTLSGSTTTDSHGNFQLNVPADQVGITIIHVEGVDITNQPVDISATFIVQDPNDQSTCVIVSSSGQDIDHDGIDDACDAVIGSVPADTPPTSNQPIPPQTTSTTDQSNTAQPTNTVTTDGSGSTPNSIDISASANTLTAAVTIDNNLQSATSLSGPVSTGNTQANQVPAVQSTNKSSEVIGAITTNLHQAALSTNQGLQFIALVHPVGFSFVILALLFAITILAYLHIRGIRIIRSSTSARPHFVI